MFRCYSTYNAIVTKNRETVFHFLVSQDVIKLLSNNFVHEFYIGDLEYKDNRTVFINHLLNSLPFFTHNSKKKTEDLLTLVKKLRLRMGHLEFTLFSASVHIHDYGGKLNFSEEYKDLEKLSVLKSEYINKFNIEEEIHLNFYSIKEVNFSDAFTLIYKKYKLLYEKENPQILHKPYMQLPTQRVTGRKLF